MNRREVVMPVTMIVNACAWGFAMVMSAYALRGTGAYQQIQFILAGCALTSLIVVGGGLTAMAKKKSAKAS
jgi:short subunit fatty acids transporter